jgi:hypothetical protein
MAQTPRSGVCKIVRQVARQMSHLRQFTNQVKLSHYPQWYLAKFQYRFNRRFDLRVILAGLLGDAIRSKPRREASLRERIPAEISA